MTSTIYNLKGEVIETRTETGRTVTATDGTSSPVTITVNGQSVNEYLVTNTVYDKYGRVAYTTDLHLPTTPVSDIFGSRSIYDDLGRVVRTERLSNVNVVIQNGDAKVSGTPSQVSYSTTTYDAKGKVERSPAADGQVTRFEYDDMGRQVAVIGHAVQVGSQWIAHRAETVYDAHGRRDQEIVNLQQVWSKDPNGTGTIPAPSVVRTDARVTSFEYDARGNVVKTVLPDSSFVTATFDDQGRQLTETSAFGLTKTFEYDEQGRLTAVILPAVVNPLQMVNGQAQMESPRYEYGYAPLGIRRC